MQTPLDIIEAFYAALAARDRDTLISLLKNDIRITYFGQKTQLPWAGEFSGLDGFDTFFTRIRENLEIVSVERDHIIADSKRVAVQCSGTWRVKHNQKQVSAGMMNVFTVEQNQISRYDIYVDTAAFFEAMA
ncbi:MAG: nuclear transport factor 2 family protein [Pseudomonadota bacterium]